jgi:sensor c-di-GMP phosphodiesterase-like protein
LFQLWGLEARLRSYRLIAVARDVCVVIVPIIAAAVIAYQLSLHDQRGRAQIMADVVLNRSELTTEQLASAFTRLSVFDAAHACSPEAVKLMREVDLGSSLLQGLGYVADNQLQCSSLGEAGAVELGAPDYVSATNAIIRRQRTLPIAPGTSLLLVTGQSGYTGIVHPALIFSLADEHGDLPAGTATYSTRKTILYSGSHTFDWATADLAAGQYSGTLVMGDQLLAWRRSGKWDQFSYAAIPFAAVDDEFRGSIGFYLALGFIAGLAVLVLLRRLTANRTSLPALLKAGLARGEIHTVYQPIVDMRTGRWVGAEVLARWERPSGEQISPDVFVPIAEKNGLIRHLTRRVMMNTAEDLKAFVTMAPDFFVSINITSMDLQDPDFVRQVLAECDARGVAHQRVHLEITERAEVDPAKEAETIKALREEGFEIGIDDFGIGYSNLAYLDTLHVDYLKIDKAFVAGISNGALGTAVVDHIIELGAERGLKVIAEGVEQEEQRAALVARKVWLGQGWLFAKPMPASSFAAAFAEMAASMRAEPLTVAQVA